jgi:hypothetical protein
MQVLEPQSAQCLDLLRQLENSDKADIHASLDTLRSRPDVLEFVTNKLLQEVNNGTN